MQATPVTRTSQAANSSQAGRSTISQAGNPQASPVDSTLFLTESEISQTGSSQASQADSALPWSAVSQTGSSQASPIDCTLPLAESEISQAGRSQASPVDNTPPQAESAVLPQVVRHSARLRALQASNNSQAGSSRQPGNTHMVDSATPQPDSDVPQAASSQASASQEARSSPLLIGTIVLRVLSPGGT